MPIDTRRVEPVETIYVVHHLHIDVGFTNDQPIFNEWFAPWALCLRDEI